MKFCKDFLNKPSTRKSLRRAFKPMISNMLKYASKTIKTIKYNKKELKDAKEKLLKTSIESFNKSFMETCSKGCKELENTPYPCGPENEKIMTMNLQKIDPQEMSNNGIKLLDFYKSQAKAKKGDPIQSSY